MATAVLLNAIMVDVAKAAPEMSTQAIGDRFAKEKTAQWLDTPKNALLMPPPPAHLPHEVSRGIAVEGIDTR